MTFSASLLAAHGRPCPYCGIVMRVIRPRPTKRPEFPTRDHVIPRSVMRGQPTVIVCLRCNSDKGGLILSEWLIKLRERNDARSAHVAKFIGMNKSILGELA